MENLKEINSLKTQESDIKKAIKAVKCIGLFGEHTYDNQKYIRLKDLRFKDIISIIGYDVFINALESFEFILNGQLEKKLKEVESEIRKYSIVKSDTDNDDLSNLLP